MSKNYAVVLESEVLDEAYGMGYDRFNGAESEATLAAVDHFTESSTYANCVDPRLRALAGYDDAGYGTYTVTRDVVVVAQGDGDDLPMGGECVGAAAVYDAVVDAWRNGAYDALDGNERGENAGEVRL